MYVLPLIFNSFSMNKCWYISYSYSSLYGDLREKYFLWNVEIPFTKWIIWKPLFDAMIMLPRVLSECHTCHQIPYSLYGLGLKPGVKYPSPNLPLSDLRLKIPEKVHNVSLLAHKNHMVSTTIVSSLTNFPKPWSCGLKHGTVTSYWGMRCRFDLR